MFKLHVVPVGQTLISHDSKPTRKDLRASINPEAHEHGTATAISGHACGSLAAMHFQ